jgi:hypothetical protein
MPRDKNAGRSHGIKSENISFEREEGFRYLGDNLNISKFYSGRN